MVGGIPGGLLVLGLAPSGVVVLALDASDYFPKSMLGIVSERSA